MKKKIVILLIALFAEPIGFPTNGDSPIKLLSCYIYIIKRAIEEQKWSIDLIVKDRLCNNSLAAYEFMIDKDTLWVKPRDYSNNSYKLKSFLISDSVAIVQFQMDTAFVDEKNFRRSNHRGKNSYIEFSVILDNSKETGVRVSFGNTLFLEDKKRKHITTDCLK